MLHKDMMFRFNPELEFPTRLPTGMAETGQVQSHGTDPDPAPENERDGLVWRVAGNTVAGAAFLAALLALPVWLDRLLSML